MIRKACSFQGGGGTLGWGGDVTGTKLFFVVALFRSCQIFLLLHCFMCLESLLLFLYVVVKESAVILFFADSCSSIEFFIIFFLLSVFDS